MEIGFIGLGKLGLPCALAMSVHSNKTIHGYDISPKIKDYLETKSVPYVEKEIDHYLQEGSISLTGSVDEVISASDIVFIAVQTPHEPRFEGVTPIPEERADFDYSFLVEAVRKVNEAALNYDKRIDVVIISTVLPGTINATIKPLITATNINLIYNPYFIAMGTTIEDFLRPEFILIGANEYERLVNFYKSFISAPVCVVRTTSAEIVKVTYNTFIGMKIIFANMIGEMVEKLDAGCANDVIYALSHATKRIISPAYMRAGMGDGGGCHPRDQIAMSWLSKRLDLSTDMFEFIAKTREEQTKFFAKILQREQKISGLEVVILGESYKKNIGLTIGSPVKLLEYYLDELGVVYEVLDPYLNNQPISFDKHKIFFVATPHDDFKSLSLPMQSIVIDPWGESLTHQYTVFTKNIGRYKKD